MRPLPLALLLVALGCPSTPVGDPEPTPAPPSFCEEQGFGREEAFNTEGPFGSRRQELAEDFWVPVRGAWEPAETWDFDRSWTGCETYVFVPDTLVVSDDDDTILWEADLDTLVATSPRNAHYFFVSRRNQADADSNLAAMEERVADLLGTLDEADAAWWSARLHVVATRSADLGGWVGDVLAGVGRGGFAIDRFQRIRGLGSLSDVARYESSLPNWKWTNNVAYAVHEPRFYNMEAARQDRLDAVDATIVPLWTGETLGGGIDATFTLPSASELAAFDTLELDVSMRCPDEEAPEPGNCGAWDYLAYLFVRGAPGEWIEIGRFITTYHREARWVVDVTPMLAHLLAGGATEFRWDGGGQATRTFISLRLSNQGRGMAPRTMVPLFDGGMSGQTRDVPIPATARKVELWAYLTGHGQDGSSGCAEFCDHLHDFMVGDATYRRDHPTVGDPLGCVAEIEDQMTPNQWGTWWFGRGGWCPGQHVEPFVVDVTADAPAGQTATLGYQRLNLAGTANDGGGNIRLASWLAIYE